MTGALLSGTITPLGSRHRLGTGTVSYTHLRAHETGRNLVCRLLLEQMHTIDKQRLKKHIGTLDAGDALAAGNALLIRPGLTKKNEPLRYTVQAVVHILRTKEELSI